MTLQEHKRLGSFYGVPRRYKYLCLAFSGNPSCPAAVLRAYVYAMRIEDEVLLLSEADLAELLDFEWGVRSIRAARKFLISLGLLVPGSARNGQRSSVTVDLRRLEQLESEIPDSWETDLKDRLRLKTAAKTPSCPRSDTAAKRPGNHGETAAVAAPHPLAITRTEELASSASPAVDLETIKARFFDVLGGLPTLGKKLMNRDTVERIVKALGGWSEEVREVKLLEMKEALKQRRAGGFGLLVTIARAEPEEAPPPKKPMATSEDLSGEPWENIPTEFDEPARQALQRMIATRFRGPDYERLGAEVDALIAKRDAARKAIWERQQAKTATAG